MSVQTEIDRISTAVQNAHLKVIEKGGTSAAPYLVANLPDAIDTIPIGEEVTAETSAYTELLTDLEVAVEDLPEATAPKLQAKTATPSETAQTVKPDSGYDGLSQVSVGAISKTYVGSGVTKQAAKTITPSTSSQTAVASGVYTTGAVTVAAIPSTYVKPTATKAATTYTPSTSNQTIAAGTYCSGTQTIKGDMNLVAGNIKSGVSIFGVAGSFEGGGSGGGVETCTVTMNAGRKVPESSTFYYVSESGLATGSTPTGGATVQIQCMKPSLLVRILGYSTIDVADGEANHVVSAQAYDVIYINGDTTISVKSI